ncbi:helix-turn-helix domain-containing protein [Streptomyces sp. NBC_00572]|uniref:AraC-like ligand-binding domain-containing protein n=1 Tax=Streptomyces sp. NBC_00572 TaxID=2903664 RepID=UPI00224E2F0D|nr:helix-turn-helix domain-containing protein [Streptomyces sp. NBC_00572]MCX4984071.1 helix-turn-helix domain-containing protein [Streptomyces sp. NBC_00572]
MSATLDTAPLSPQERAEAVRHAIWESVVKIDIDHHHPPQDLSVKVSLNKVGCIVICSGEATSLTIRRTQRLAREDTEPYVFLGLQATGTSLVQQNDRQAVLRAGEFALYDTSVPYALSFEAGVDHHFLRFPRSALALPERSLREMTAVTFGAENPVAALTFAYFSQLAVTDGLRHERHAQVITEPSVELIRAAVASRLGDSQLARESMETTLNLRIMRYMREHLRDRDLSAARIASVHGVSVRHLYTLLARSGITLGDWIRSQRLAGCHRELAAPSARHRTIAAIGRGWGFVDATHFSKVFKQEYGLTPRDWRDLNRA